MSSQKIGYIRVSTLDQSTERQLDGIAVDKVFTDKASGKDTDRPQLQAALHHIRTGDTLIVHSMDGLARNVEDIQGQARFQSSNTVVINDDVLQADKIFINVGGRGSIPAMPGIQDVPFLTNSSMMDVDFLPEHLVIIGGSYIGLEFGQMYRRFGSEVTIVEMGPRLIGR